VFGVGFGLRSLAKFVTVPSAPTSPPLSQQLFLDFSIVLFKDGRFNIEFYLEPVVI